MKFKSLHQLSRAARAPLATVVVCICITSAQAADWSGSTSTDWNTGSNWSNNGGSVPNGVDVGINTGSSNFPVISADAGTISSLSIGNGWGGTGRLDQTAGSLAVQNGGWPYGWVLVGGNGYSTGIYNIANTATTGGTFTGYGTGSGSLSTGGDLRVGAGSWWPNANGLMNINTSGTVHVGGWFVIGGNGGTGTVNIDAGTVSVNGDTRIGADGSNATGNLNINTSSTFSTNGQLAVGAGSNNTGTVNIVAGTVTANNAWIGSGDATTTANGTLNISGGSLTLVNRLAIGVGNSSSGGVNVGVVTLSGGTLTTNTNNDWGNAGVNMASGYDSATGGSATFNLNGGTLSTLYIFSEGTKGTSIFNFNGGTLQGQANRDWINSQFFGANVDWWDPANTVTRANVRNGGAVIDTNGYNLYVSQSLEHSNIGGDAAIDGGLTKNGAGQLQITGVDSFTGQVVVNSGTLYATTFNYSGSAAFGTSSGITVNNGATLKANSNSLFGSYSSHAAPITVNAGGTAITQDGRQDAGLLTLNGGTLASAGTIGDASWTFGRFSDKKLLVTANSTVSADKVGFRNGATIEVASGSKLDFTGTISDNSDGASSVIKTGSGSLVLSGANSYTGTTTVNGGTLVVNGNQSAATGAVTVSSGATLKGSGTVGGNTTISGTHAPGAVGTPGQQTFAGTLTYNSGSIFEWDLNAATNDPGANTSNSGTYGQVAATGTVGGTSSFKVVLGTNSFTSAFWDTNKTWTNIFTGSGVTTGTLANLFGTFDTSTGVDSTGHVAGQGYFTFNSSNTLTWTAVPEPTSALAGLLLGAGLLRRRRSA